MRRGLVLLALFAFALPASASTLQSEKFEWRIAPIAAAQKRVMTGVSWHSGCPVGLSELRDVRVSYIDPAPSGAPAPPTVTVRYIEGSRGIEIKPSAPLDRRRRVKVELVEGILSAVDNKPLAPWALTFTTGG